jgi:hypothetical protein
MLDDTSAPGVGLPLSSFKILPEKMAAFWTKRGRLELSLLPMLSAVGLLHRITIDVDRAPALSSIGLLQDLGCWARRSLHVEPILKIWFTRGNTMGSNPLWRRFQEGVAPFLGALMNNEQASRLRSFCQSVLMRRGLLKDDNLVLFAASFASALGEVSMIEEISRFQQSILWSLAALGRALIHGAGCPYTPTELLPEQMEHVMFLLNQLRFAALDLTLLNPPCLTDQEEDHMS